MSLSPEQIQSYRENGYLVMENLIEEPILERLRQVIRNYREQSRHVDKSNEIFDIGAHHSFETPKLRRLKDPVLRHPEFDLLMRSNAVVDIVAELLGGTVRFDHSKLNFKPPEGLAKVGWHQDWAFYPHTNDDLLAVGVMLEDCTLENGPLMVVPGSHRGPIYNHHRNGLFVGAISPQLLADQLDKAVSLTAPAGSISIHHVRMLHASGENQSDRERPLLLYSYAAVDSFPIFKQWDFEEFDNRILRGESTLEPRAIQVPMRIHLPRAQGADSIYDDQSKS